MISFDTSIKLPHSIQFAGYVNVMKKSFLGCYYSVVYYLPLSRENPD